MSSSLSKLIEIGKVSRLHGYSGALVIYTPTSKESSLGNLKNIWIGLSPEKAVPFKIRSASWMPKGWKVELLDILSEDAAKPLIGHSVFAQRDSLPTLDKNEFYLSDLLEMTAYDWTTQEPIGRFLSLEESASDKLVKTSCWVFETKSGTLSIPAVAHFIHSVDLKQKRVWLHNLKDLP